MGSNRKLLSSAHVRSVSEVADMVPNPLTDYSTRKSVQHVEHSEAENVQVSTSRELTDNNQRSSANADSHTNMQHTTSQETDVSINNSFEDTQTHSDVTLLFRCTNFRGLDVY